MLVRPSLLFTQSVVVWCKSGVCVLILPFNSLLNSPLKETSLLCRGNMASCWKLLLEILWMVIRNLKDSNSAFSNTFQGIILQRKTLASDCGSRTRVWLLGRSGGGVSRVALSESCWQSRLQRYYFVCRATAEEHSPLPARTPRCTRVQGVVEAVCRGGRLHRSEFLSLHALAVQAHSQT